VTNSYLKLQTYRAAFWSFADAVGSRLVHFVIGIVLARLLLPEQFGLIAMLTIFMAIAQSLLDSGFGSALVQKKDVTETDTSSVFYLNVFISLILAVILCLVSPLIANFYGQSELLPITQAMSVVVIINSFVVVQQAMLTRKMDFKIQAKVSLIAGIASGGFGISMAYNGYGVWSLVVQQITAALFRAIFLWLYNPWRPKLLFSFHALREMFSFGSRMLVSGLLNQIFNNLYYVVIGRLFSPVALGFYFRARTLAEMPSATLSGIVTRVSFPVFSSIQDDDARLKRALRKALGMLIFINAPVMIGLAVVAKSLVLVLLTEKWLPCVPYLQLLCIVGLLLPLHTLNLNILMAKGRSDLFLRLEIIKKVLLVLNIAILWRWGIVPIIGGQMVLSVLAFFLNSYYTGKLLNYNAFAQIKDVAIYCVLALIMGVVVHLVEYLPVMNAALLLVVQIMLGMVVYLLMSKFFNPPAFSEAWYAIRHKIAIHKMQTREKNL
jgi:O-antigen/teichoic acid export membrane protein